MVCDTSSTYDIWSYTLTLTVPLDYYNVLFPSGTPVGRFVGGAESEHRYYHTDHLGSTRAVTDPSGQVIERRVSCSSRVFLTRP
ncbi:MAG: hypothetical protein PPP56_05020 [Longimonas sp.]|uniref:hypothetical protein n=1 Tax=Longimonas sp. TaxID=2039626 RepID=UPI00335F3178